MMQPAENGGGGHSAGGLRRVAIGHPLLDTLVWTKGIVVVDVAYKNRVQLGFACDDEVIKGFPTNGADESLGIRVHVGSFDGGGDATNAVQLIVLEELTRAVVDEKGFLLAALGE